MGEVIEFERPGTENVPMSEKPEDRWQALERIAMMIDGRPDDPLFVRQALRAVLQIFPTSANDARGKRVRLLAAALLRALAEVPPETPRSA